ncbi:hypothetical protein OBBRIDRAFT_799023 [Obba rivulosa]|uniref:BTB domain-containing protein n=1 Tax=Obba rivulosa TaxID=1052685 RepID=A0A8E2APR9_9APHY|nr:hypothetical protein OBBRIDRAFT_799023 [Obba rivulosa]
MLPTDTSLNGTSSPESPGKQPDAASDTHDSSTKEASHPFNKPSADTILRTSDRVDFRIRRSILVEASPVFEDMFSIPQAPTSAADGHAPRLYLSTGDDAVPIIDVTEDSTTMDSLLRLCYPIADPTFLFPGQLSPILDAASKYMMEEACCILKGRLVTMAKSHPVEVFAIACRHDAEEAAKATAQYMRAKLANMDTFPVDALSDVRAGPLYRVMQKHKSILKKAPFRASGASLFASIAPRSPSHPFDKDASGDATLRSSDGVLFRVHTQILRIGAPGLYALLIRLMGNTVIAQLKGCPNDGNGQELVLDVAEDRMTLDRLLRLCYPVNRPNMEAVSEIYPLIAPAKRYGMEAVLKVLKDTLKSLAASGEDPLRIYAVACASGWEAEAKHAAKCVLRYGLGRSRYVAELEDISAAAYFRLLQYSDRCSRVVSEMARKDAQLDISKASRLWGSCRKCLDPASRGWWQSFVRDAAEALQERPSAKTIQDQSRCERAIIEATLSCSACGPQAVRDLRNWTDRFSLQIEQTIDSVCVLLSG